MPAEPAGGGGYAGDAEGGEDGEGGGVAGQGFALPDADEGVDQAGHGDVVGDGDEPVGEPDAGDRSARGEEHDEEEGAADRLGAALGVEDAAEEEADGEPIQLSTSWEPLTLTIGTPVERPENGPQVGVVARMDTIGVHIDECEEKVADRPAHADEIEALDLSPRRAHVQVIRRTYLAQGRPVETADIVLPAGRYELVYRYPIE